MRKSRSGQQPRGVKNRTSPQWQPIGFGLAGSSKLDSNQQDEIDDDADLETELAQLIAMQEGAGGQHGNNNANLHVSNFSRSSTSAYNPNMVSTSSSKHQRHGHDDLEQQHSDEDDLDDEDLLNELQQIQNEPSSCFTTNSQATVPSIPDLGEEREDILDLCSLRLAMYHSHAEQFGHSQFVQHSISKIEVMVEQIKCGDPNFDICELPPPPDESSGQMTRESPLTKKQEVVVVCEDDVQLARQMREQYKRSALQSRSDGDKLSATKALNAVKAMDLVISKLMRGEVLAADDYPNLYEEDASIPDVVKTPSRSSEGSTEKPSDVVASQEIETIKNLDIETRLNMALDHYRKEEVLTKQQTDDGTGSAASAKARRLGRICKQYEDALKSYKRVVKMKGTRDLLSLREDVNVKGLEASMAQLPVPPKFPAFSVLLPPMKKEDQRNCHIQSMNDKETHSSEHHPSNIQNTGSSSTLNVPVTAHPPPHQSASESAMNVTKEQSPKSGDLSSKTPLPPAPPQKSSAQSAATSRREQEMNVLLERHRLFKESALNAKKCGNVDLARSYLKTVKGIEILVESARNGLPIDMKSVPLPPQMHQRGGGQTEVNDPNDESSSQFRVKEAPFSLSTNKKMSSSTELSSSELSTNENSDLVIEQIEDLFLQQIRKCDGQVQRYKLTNEHSISDRMECLLDRSKRDLAAIRLLRKKLTLAMNSNGEGVGIGSEMVSELIARLCTETLTFMRLVYFVDVTDSELEIHVTCGFNFEDSVVKNLIGYFIKLEYPYPRSENMFKVKSELINVMSNCDKINVNPTFDFISKLRISRTDRSLLRIIKRHPLKVEIWGASGRSRLLLGLRSPEETYLGTAFIKMDVLESKCRLNEVSPLMTSNNRKPSQSCPSAQIQVKCRVRRPLNSTIRETERVDEQFLILRNP